MIRVPALILFLVAATLPLSAAPAGPGRVFEFTQDPGWEGFRNRLLPATLPVTQQDFGYHPEAMIGSLTPGQIGGRIQRSVTPAWYAKIIEPKTLHHRLAASGKFAVTDDESNTGVLCGWFNQDSRGWRTPNSLIFRIDGNGGKFWIFFEYGTQHWLTGGTGCFEGDRYQTTPTKPFRADGTVHEWSLDYDPNGHDSHGLIRLTLDGRVWPLPLGEGHKADGATFDRFGVFNQQISGGGMTVRFSDLVLDGKPIDLSADPKWEARGNRVEFKERVMRPFHDLGFSMTAHCGQQQGEVGGIIWRDERPAYYAARTTPLTLRDELSASGKLVLKAAGSDSAVYLGWFNSASKTNKTVSDHLEPQTNMLAVLIEGPSRIGHYFRPAYRVSTGDGADPGSGPVIRPDSQVHDWSLRYLPAGAAGRGEIECTLNGKKQSLALQPGHKEHGASFDRFGIFNLQSGGHLVEIYVDDLRFTGGTP